jgi:hypothetical protein
MKTLTYVALAAVSLAVLPSVSRAVSDGPSLDASMQEYQRPISDRGAWRNPYVPDASTAEAGTLAGGTESGGQLVARIVAQYTRAALDRGGWDNPFLPSAAAGTPIVAAEIRDGFTWPAAELAVTSGDELLMRSVAVYTRAALDRGGWENRLMRDAHYAAGAALLAVRVSEGVTTVAALGGLE